MEAIQAGASGYLTKGCPATELVEAIRTVAAGGAPRLAPRRVNAVV